MMERLNFPHKWRQWISECVSTATANVLVNGSPAGEFELHRGVRQDRIRISHLQNADDTMFTTEGSIENAKAIKWILKIFEQMSGLSVNFDKCCMYGLNMEPRELQCLADVMGCTVGTLPIEFLGMRVGVGTKRVANWDDVVGKVRKRCASWNAKNIYMGGRVTLINSTLAAIPIYRMAFSIIPASSAAKIKSLICKFLWGEREGGPRKIAWSKWEVLCRQKKRGGLGMKNITWLNWALLVKWVWRYVNEKESLWASVVRSRHGDLALDRITNNSGNRGMGGTGWWGSIIRFLKSEKGGWFVNKVKRVLGCGSETAFWEDKWCGDSSLREKFPCLFHLSAAKEGLVNDFGRWDGDCWSWVLKWRRELLEREELAANKFRRYIKDVVPRRNSLDSWSWGSEADGVYLVRSGYLSIEADATEAAICAATAKVRAAVWKTCAPHKVQTMA